MRLLTIGHPALRKKAKRVPASLVAAARTKNLAKRMIQIMRKEEGVGLAANQIGKNVQLFVMECRKNRRYPKAPPFPLQAWINPEIIFYSDQKVNDWEGCLSIPGYRGRVPRSKSILFEATSLDGERIRTWVRGFEARVIQHEVDHLNGVFYIDHLKNFKNWIHVQP